MASYDFARSSGSRPSPNDFVNRFAERDVIGGERFGEVFLGVLESGGGFLDLPLFDELWQESRRSLRRREKPRLFVSHQRLDTTRAREIAGIAREHGFDIWLDVLDPLLPQEWVDGPDRKNEEAASAAAIIEIALLNCTHVLAIYTRHAGSSRWVPYEYGRVKDERVFSSQASARTDLPDASLPEYLFLGSILRSDESFRGWLDDEREAWKQVPW